MEHAGLLEPPSPIDPLAASAASMGGRSVGSNCSIQEDLDVNTSGLVEETMERLSRVRGVLGVMIIDSEGRVVRTTMDDKAAAQHAVPVQQLVQRALGVVALTPGDRFGMLCVRTTKHEMLMCHERQGAFTILVIQNPNAEIDVANLVQGAAAA